MTPPDTAPTLAQRQASQHLASNLDALARTQPRLRDLLEARRAQLGDYKGIEWVFARDRTLTWIDQTGRWCSGCSLPTRAAQAMLAKLDVRSAVACFLSPDHAAHLRVALERLRAEQALVAVVGDDRDLVLMLHCDDFSTQIQSHRLWFAAGEDWPDQFLRLFEDQPGLAAPSQLIRLPTLDSAQSDALIAAAQRAISQVSAGRTSAVESLRRQPLRNASNLPRLLVVSPTRFRLWNDAGAALGMALAGESQLVPVVFDADDPLCSSPLALLQAAVQCHAIISVNNGRTDLPGLIPETTPWITWSTSGRIPSAALAGADDHLIVHDPQMRNAAIRVGWPESRVHVGAWPKVQIEPLPRPSPGFIALLADTCPLDTPQDLTDYSSHGLLWEHIREELRADALRVGDDAVAYLTARIRTLDIRDDGFAHARFIEQLIVPGYQQGIARLLLGARLPLRVWGRGWDQLPEFASIAAGPVETREQFESIVGSASAVLRAWPTKLLLPIDSVAAPIVLCAGRRREQIIQDARAALAGGLAAQNPPRQTLNGELLCALVQRVARRAAA